MKLITLHDGTFESRSRGELIGMPIRCSAAADNQNKGCHEPRDWHPLAVAFRFTKHALTTSVVIGWSQQFRDNEQGVALLRCGDRLVACATIRPAAAALQHC